MSANAAQLKGKLNSFKGELKSSNAAIFTVQETHYATKGKIQIPNFEIFEAIRKKKKDGGTIIGAHLALKPMLIKEYSEDFELIVIEIVVGGKDIRVISGYGPQETWPENERMPFFLALEEEIHKAEMLGKSIILQMDANSKLGPGIIDMDPHGQSQNGRVLAGIIERHRLIVVNSLKDKCLGLITRRRVTQESIEESIIDFVITSDDLEDNIESMLVDEEKKHAITGYIKTKRGSKTVESDHNPIVSKFNFKWRKSIQKRKIEMFNLKNTECQKKFKELTSDTNFLSSVFDNDNDINSVTKKFLKRLTGVLHKSFRKVKICEKTNKALEDLFKKRTVLRTKTDADSIEELKKVEEELAEKCAKDNRDKIKEEISGIKCEEGGIHSGRLWRLRKKLFPKSRDPPTAMKDPDGNLVTSEEEIEKLAIQTYQKRLQNRPMKEDLHHIRKQKEELCSRRLEAAKKNTTPPWTMNDLEKVLKSLKKNKARDPLGLANEIFHPDVAGEDLKIAILKLMNKIRFDQRYPEALELRNISSIWKLKGSRNEF